MEAGLNRVSHGDSRRWMTNRAVERSRELWAAQWFCAETVLLAVAEELKVERGVVPRIATGLCAGLRRTGDLCGALAGGILAIGLALGRDAPSESVDSCHGAVRDLIEWFRARFGSDRCRELTGYDLGTHEGRAAYRAGDGRRACGDFVAAATEMAMTMISGSGPRGTAP